MTLQAPSRSHLPPLARLWNSPYLLLVLATLFWSGNFIVGRALHASMLPIALVFWRWTLSLAILVPLAWPHRAHDLPVLIRYWPNVLVLGVLGVATYNALIYVGLGATTAVNALLVQSMLPVFIPICAFCVFGERLQRTQLAGLVLSLAGIAVVASRGSPAALLELQIQPGDAWMLAAVLAYALYSVALRKRPPVRPTSLLAASVAVGVLLLLPAYLWEGLTTAHASHLTVPTALGVGYLAVFASVLAYICFNRCVELIGANRAGMGLHLLPGFGSVLAVIFLGETLHLFHLAAATLIAVGIALAMRR